jgi:hypothetical protein
VSHSSRAAGRGTAASIARRRTSATNPPSVENLLRSALAGRGRLTLPRLLLLPRPPLLAHPPLRLLSPPLGRLPPLLGLPSVLLLLHPLRRASRRRRPLRLLPRLPFVRLALTALGGAALSILPLVGQPLLRRLRHDTRQEGDERRGGEPRRRVKEESEASIQSHLMPSHLVPSHLSHALLLGEPLRGQTLLRLRTRTTLGDARSLVLLPLALPTHRRHELTTKRKRENTHNARAGAWHDGKAGRRCPIVVGGVRGSHGARGKGAREE